jgi:hypothetical protein
LIEGAAFEELVADIKAHGVREAVVLRARSSTAATAIRHRFIDRLAAMSFIVLPLP